MIKLLADAGSTKVDWCMVDDKGQMLGRCATDGVNAMLVSPGTLAATFAAMHKEFAQLPAPEEIHYYGAGCATPRACALIKKGLHDVYPTALVNVYSDLLAAARALCGNKPGIACVLGTGSNSCLYDGEEISHNIPSLGYVLGDEGSGAALGKRLIADAFKGQLPEMVRENFLKSCGLTLADMLEKVYRTEAPSRFLASLVPFIKDNLWNPYIYNLVHEEFTCFIKRNVAMYVGAHSLPVSFIGSIASVFSDILREAADQQGFTVDQIESSPMPGLIHYHTTLNP